MHNRRAIPKLLGLLLMPVSALFLAMGSFWGETGIQFPISITLLLVADILFMSVDFSRNVLFIVFQGTFFLFLIAGPLLDGLEGIDFYQRYSEEVVFKAYICYWIAAFAMWCYCLYHANGGPRLRIGNRREVSGDDSCGIVSDKIIRIRYISKLLFYITIIAYVVVTLDKVIFRQSFSLQQYYASYDVSSNLPGIIVKIADCHLISLAMFLATRPSKREAKIPLIVFVIASSLTILYGVRNVIILNVLFMLVYFVLRNGDGDEVWITRRSIITGVVLSPVIMVLLQAFDVFRRSIAFNVFDVKELFSFSLVRDFFVSQSVSSYILPNALTHFSQLGGQPVPYTFGTLYTYLTQNMITRFFTGVAAYTSNSVESAMSSGNLGARLAYSMYRESFLSGTGMGGCYIADLFVDFSYIGVFIGTIIACMILTRLSNVASDNKEHSPFWFAFVLVAIRWVIYMPRDSYFSWAMQAFSFMNLIFVFMVYVLSKTKRVQRVFSNRGSDQMPND